MDSDLAQEAISQALSGNWDQAVKINKFILTQEPNDIDALNRLARAYAELGNLDKAKKTCQKVLKIDPFNSIATKAQIKWKELKKGDTYTSRPVSPVVFLEEPGKTKIVSLLHLGSSKILAKLDSGDEVQLSTHSHRVCVMGDDGKYIGKLPDDLSAKLRKLIKMGNEYQVFIKSIDKNDTKVFIRETKRSKKLSDVPSFQTEKFDYIPFTPPELVHKKEEIVREIEVDEED